LSTSVRLSAGLALIVSALVVSRLSLFQSRLAHLAMPPAAVALFVLGMAGWHLTAYGAWAARRTAMNHEASRALGELLPAGTEIQGKLANGLALENRIRPLFVGNGFGNYADRLQRHDVAYILTYDLPRIGYESQDGSGLIDEILQHYPDRQLVQTFPVDETSEVERAALFRKFPAPIPADARD
jgi:hypothetical protein